MGVHRSLGRAALAAAVLALQIPAPALAAAPTARLPSAAQLKACPRLADLDLRKIAASSRPDPGWRARMDTQHAMTRGPVGAGFTPPDDAQVTLRVWAGGGETQMVQTQTSSIVWKDAGGTWRVNRVDFSNAPPPPPPIWDGTGAPPPPMTQADIEAQQRTLTQGALAPAQAAEIERTLADPCFALQPDALPMNLPVKRGREPRPPCWGVTGGTLEIRWTDGRRRDVTELCGGFYARGAIDAVMYAKTAEGGAE